ncbi:MAG: hypothetical protein M0P11_01325 [Anaerolineaceae bacterium]|nr:hypothetical protein [Anaerolineaceae bacterium]
MSRKVSFVRNVCGLLLALFLLAGCALSFQTKEPKSTIDKLNLPSAISEVRLVEVRFIAHPFRNFTEEDEISLDILDLLTGVHYNLQRYLLNKSAEGHSLTVMLPQGAVISYRYTLTHPIEMGELLPDGSPLAFRQLVVRDNLVIQDNISGWPEVPYNGPLVDLNGAVADDETDEPIADVLVNVAGKTALTDMNGRFFIRGLPVGSHNLVATLCDGSYLNFQQEVNMVENLATQAVILMTALPEVTLTLVMSPPNEAVGAPVRIAGNLRQLGLTFYDMLQGTGTQAVNMPLMARNTEGKYVAQIRLFAGSFLRYEYSLGDALINSERDLNGNRLVRQFIVPNKDAVIDDSVTTWRASKQDAVTIFASSPAGTPEDDQLFLQFDHGSWTNPIPMWPMGNNVWMLVYFPRAASSDQLIYRYCRNADCSLGQEHNPDPAPRAFMPGAVTEIHDEIIGWRMWDSAVQNQSSPTPLTFDEEALVGVEVDPFYSSSHLNAWYELAENLKTKGFNWLILRPVWKVGTDSGLPFIDSDPTLTLPAAELKRIAEAASQQDLKVALYPYLNFPSDAASWFRDSQKSQIWWQQWYADYERMVLHTIKLATAINAGQIILGGPDVFGSYPGATETVAENFGTPKSSQEIWTDLLTKVDEYYQGQLLLALEAGTGTIQSFSFYEQAQGFYILISTDPDQAGNDTSAMASRYLEGSLLAFHDSQQKPVYIGLNAASFKTANSSGSDNGSSIISAANPTYNSHNVDLDAQTQFYRAYLDSISTRGWISGIAARGFFPAMQLTDFSSSINGKPAFELFHNQ